MGVAHNQNLVRAGQASAKTPTTLRTPTRLEPTASTVSGMYQRLPQPVPAKRAEHVQIHCTRDLSHTWRSFFTGKGNIRK